jgi:hypothetical protein
MTTTTATEFVWRTEDEADIENGTNGTFYAVDEDGERTEITREEAESLKISWGDVRQIGTGDTWEQRGSIAQ